MWHDTCVKCYACVASLLSIVTSAALFGAEQPPQLRLPGNIVPTSYRVQLELDPKQPSFTGRVNIALNLKQQLNTIWLNANNIQLASASLKMSGREIALKVIPGGEDFVGFTTETALAAGSGELDIRYTGHLHMQGSAGVFGMEDNGNKYIFTQFEQTDARSAFPCFDEPSYKVPWQLTLSVPNEDDAISNTPIAKQRSEGGRKVFEFKQTKPLPSYLVAFAVGQFDFVPAGFAGKNRAPIRIVTPKGHGAEAKYAAEVTATILTRLEDYFGIPYPYEKSDQVAIPVTFGFGAMENAGMVTYAQNLLLASPDRDTTRRQRGYASVAAHELAHQWFGDLVTTEWWNDIWLNEAFATWMEQHLIAEWKPEWQTRVEDVNSKLYAENEDTLLSARKIRQEIKTKDDISNAFDGITYQKGAAVIGMFETYVTPSEFRRGVQAYLKRYAFGNATAPEFLESISTTTGKQVTPAFSTFLNQAGIPLVSIDLRCNGGDASLHLEQERSVPLGTTAPGNQLWQIPVCVRYGSGDNGSSACILMTDPKSDWQLKSPGCPTWVEGNRDAIGYYRVDYQGTLLSSLTQGDVQKRLNASERVDLLGNSQALAETGKLPMSDVLGLVPQFSNDRSRFVVEQSLGIAEIPNEHLVPENLRPNYQRFLDKSFAPRAHELGWTPKPGESDDDKLLRPRLVGVVATLGGDQELAKEARALADKWLADHASVNPNLRTTVLTTAAYWGDKALFDRLVAELKKTSDRQERGSIIAALGAFRDPTAIKTGMEAVLDHQIPFIEGARLLFGGMEYPATRNMAFDFMKAHFDQISKMRATGGGSDMGAQFPRVGALFCDAQSRDGLKSFFEPKTAEFTGAPRVLAQVIERVDACIADKAKQEGSVATFLQGF